jgi:hypothetical protein
VKELSEKNLFSSRDNLCFAWNAGTEWCNPLITLNKTCSRNCSRGDLFQLRLRFLLGTGLDKQKKHGKLNHSKFSLKNKKKKNTVILGSLGNP